MNLICSAVIYFDKAYYIGIMDIQYQRELARHMPKWHSRILPLRIILGFSSLVIMKLECTFCGTVSTTPTA